MRVSTKYGFSLEVSNSFCGSLLARDATYEEGVSQLVCDIVRPGDFCIDAGAHVGYYACLFKSRGARVLAIEPNPDHWPYLAQNLFASWDNILTLSHTWDARTQDTIFLDYALSNINSAEPIPFYLGDSWNDGCSSLFPENHAGGRIVPVFTRRLDSILKTIHQIGRIRLIKMDLEGAEYLALEGLGERLHDVEFLILECSDLPSVLAVDATNKINNILLDWTVKREASAWQIVPAPLPDGNYLFENRAYQ
jgi:FkbM family methyltransferase